MAKKEKEYFNLPDGSRVEATLVGDFAVHRPVGQTKQKNYVVTHRPSGRCVIRTRLKGDATSTARALAFLWDRIPHDRLEWLVDELGHDICSDTYKEVSHEETRQDPADPRLAGSERPG